MVLAVGKNIAIGKRTRCRNAVFLAVSRTTFGTCGGRLVAEAEDACSLSARDEVWLHFPQ